MILSSFSSLIWLFILPVEFLISLVLLVIIYFLLSDCKGTQTHNHLDRKRTLKHLAKLASLAKSLSVRLRTKWLWVRVLLQSLKLQILRLFRARSSLTFRQPWSVDSLWNAYVTWQDHTVKIFSTVIFFLILDLSE